MDEVLSKAVKRTRRVFKLYDMNIKDDRRALKRLLASYVGFYVSGSFGELDDDVRKGRQYLYSTK